MSDLSIHSAKSHAYLTRVGDQATELLVFTQAGNPAAGLQVPGGTIDPNETALEAVRREAWEEAGLQSLELVQPLAVRVAPSSVHGKLVQYHAFHFESPRQLPTSWPHRVTAGEDDRGLLFQYFWLPLPRAAAELIEVLREPAVWLARYFEMR